MNPYIKYLIIFTGMGALIYVGFVLNKTTTPSLEEAYGTKTTLNKTLSSEPQVVFMQLQNELSAFIASQPNLKSAGITYNENNEAMSKMIEDASSHPTFKRILKKYFTESFADLYYPAPSETKRMFFISWDILDPGTNPPIFEVKTLEDKTILSYIKEYTDTTGGKSFTVISSCKQEMVMENSEWKLNEFTGCKSKVKKD